MDIEKTLQEWINMCLLKSLSITHNVIFHALYRFFLVLHITCSVVLLSSPLSYANEHGATVLTIPVAIENFPDDQEALETLLHHEKGLKEPRVYKDKAPKCFEKAMQLTPDWLKNHYGTLPLSSVREENATQVQLSQYSFLQAIELIESDACQDDVSFVSVLDKKIAQTLKTCNQLSSLPFQGTRKSSFNLLEHPPLLCPLNYEEKEVPITFAISFNLWQKIFQHHTSAEMTKEHLSFMHKKLQSDFEKTSLTLPNHITFLDVSNKHHVEHLHQNMLHVSSVIVQTHGQQTVVLMPPISEQHPYHDLLDSTGHFLFKKEIDLSASDSVLNNELRLAHATLYSIHLNPGDILLVPANWFIYRKSISPSISMSLNCLSGDTWPLFCSQAESMKQKQENEYLTQEKCTVTKWANTEIQRHPHNKCNIFHACEKIQTAISDATQLVLNLSCMKLSSLPDVIFKIAHLKTLDLSYNQFTFLSLNYVEHLVSLNLECNQLTSFSLSHMPKLTSLNVKFNQLISFSLNHVENLVSIDLAKNRLLSFSLSHLPKLTSLNVTYNKLISFSLSHMENLVSIDLACNRLTFFSLNQVKNLVLLHLQHNKLTSFSLNHMEKLKSLNLINNRLTSFSLSYMPQLTSLKLRCNELTSFSLSHVEKLASLDLEHNHLTSFSFNYTESLQSLNLSFNCLISCSLGYAEKLGSLNLAYNLLTFFSLPHMKTLTSLNLSFNDLTDFSLNYAEKLTSLDLAHNQLTSFSLSHMQALTFLDVSNNQLSSFLSCDLPSVTYIDLCHNHLPHLGPNCISSINTHQHITLDLRNNPLSNEGITQIQENLLQRLGGNAIYYPILHPLIAHINNNTMTYKDFIALLFPHNIPPSENDCLICPITHANPSQVIVLMSGNKCYKIYDADALIKWIRTQSQSEELSEEVHNPYTREPLTFENLISAKELCVLQYLKQELGLASTENIDTIHDHKS